MNVSCDQQYTLASLFVLTLENLASKMQPKKQKTKTKTCALTAWNKHTCKVEWTWLTTELLRCSYADAVKAMEAKRPAHPLQNILQSLPLCSRQGISENQQSWIQETTVHRGQQTTQRLVLRVCFLFLLEEQRNKQVPLRHTLGFCFWESVAIQK